MAILFELVLIIAAVIAIISFFAPKKEKEEKQEKEQGLYTVNIKIDDNKHIDVKSVVELISEYGDDEIHVKHSKALNTFINVEEGFKVLSILNKDHNVIKRNSVKWEKTK